jgi:hypothetical protein
MFRLYIDGTVVEQRRDPASGHRGVGTSVVQRVIGAG